MFALNSLTQPTFILVYSFLLDFSDVSIVSAIKEKKSVIKRVFSHTVIFSIPTQKYVCKECVNVMTPREISGENASLMS